MLLNAERLMLTHIARQPVATWTLTYLTEDHQATFRHLHKAGCVAPSDDYLSYHISVTGIVALNVDDGPYRALFEYTRDAGEAW